MKKRKKTNILAVAAIGGVGLLALWAAIAVHNISFQGGPPNTHSGL